MRKENESNILEKFLGFYLDIRIFEWLGTFGLCSWCIYSLISVFREYGQSTYFFESSLIYKAFCTMLLMPPHRENVLTWRYTHHCVRKQILIRAFDEKCNYTGFVYSIMFIYYQKNKLQFFLHSSGCNLTWTVFSWFYTEEARFTSNRLVNLLISALFASILLWTASERELIWSCLWKINLSIENHSKNTKSADFISSVYLRSRRWRFNLHLMILSLMSIRVMAAFLGVDIFFWSKLNQVK